MDVWIVAAAAGAGYLAQHLKNLSQGKHYLSDLSSANANFDRQEPVEDEHCSFRSVLWKNKLVKDGCREETKVSQEASAAEMASTSGFGGENMVALENLMICSTSPNSNLLPGVLNNEDVLEDWEGRGQNIDEVHSDLSCQLSAREMGFSNGLERNRSRLRTRRTNRQFIKPLTSLESCLMAQLYKEHSEIEEYTFSSTHSPRKPTVQPFVVTDGSRIISRAGYESFSSPTGTGKYNLHKSTYSQDGEVVLGIPGLPKVALMECRNKAKTEKEKVARSINSCRMVNGDTNYSPEGSSGGALNFYLGFSVGIISSFLAHKREIEKLNTLLRQTENLVQDLQEELEMKDLLTMKELAVENYESQDIHNDSYYKEAVNAFSPEQKKVDNSTEYCREEYGDQKVEDISFSNIEAELEAELERLELNMSSSKLEKKISNLAEVDKDFIADVVEGELRADLFDKPYVDQDENGCSTPCSVNYAVSPRELSLRLHEVIQSQLEERVKELETALQNSQRKMKYAESKNATCWSEFSNNGAGSYEDASTDEPAIINLSGEALPAYNEAYDEFAKVTESDEEDTPSGLEEGNEQEILQGGQQVHNGGSCHYTRHSFVNGSPLLPNHRKDIICSTDENGDGEEEMERLLIRQIVEKARKGSPVILNAQRALFSTDEYQH